MICLLLLGTFPVALRQVLFVFLARFLDLRKDLVIVKVLARWVLSCNRRKQILTQRHLETPFQVQSTSRCEYQEVEPRPHRQSSSWRRRGFRHTPCRAPRPIRGLIGPFHPHDETIMDKEPEAGLRLALAGESQRSCQRAHAPKPDRAGLW